MTEIFMNMAEKNKSSDILVQECLKGLGISLLGDWDVLIFLYRHRVILGSSEQIASLLGYPSQAVSDALDRLESQGLVRRSRSSLGVRFYQFVFSEGHLAPESYFRRLISLAQNRSGRLLLAKRLRQGVDVHIAAKGKKE
jgi:predicted transcriptional regulator